MRRIILIAMLTLLAITMVAKDCKKADTKWDLSDDQKEQIEQIKTEHQKEMVDLQATQKKAAIELKSLMDDPKASSSDLKKAFDAVHEAQNEIESKEIEMMLAIRELLDDEQKKEYAPYLYSGMGGCCGMGHGGMTKGDHKCQHSEGKGEHKCQHGKTDASTGHEDHKCQHHK